MERSVDCCQATSAFVLAAPHSIFILLCCEAFTASLCCPSPSAAKQTKAPVQELEDDIRGENSARGPGPSCYSQGRLSPLGSGQVSRRPAHQSCRCVRQGRCHDRHRYQNGCCSSDKPFSRQGQWLQRARCRRHDQGCYLLPSG